MIAAECWCSRPAALWAATPLNPTCTINPGPTRTGHHHPQKLGGWAQFFNFFNSLLNARFGLLAV